MIKPITPAEVIDEKEKIIPSFVLEVFNGCIAKNWNGYNSKFKLNDVFVLVEKAMKVSQFTGDKFEPQWLDIEPIYEKAGWKVTYDKPGYNENYDATFEFKKP